MKIISNQPKTGEVYLGLSLYKDGKHIGYHNGHRITKKIVFYTKCYIDMFLTELTNVCEQNGVSLKIINKQF